MSFVLFVCANKLLLRCLQDKAAKSILDRPLHSSSTDALIFLRRLNLEERRKCHRCIYAYKCINGQLEHSLDILRKSDTHSYNNRNKDTIKLPKIRCNWGKHRSRYHCFKYFNELERTVRNSASWPIFKKCLFSAFLLSSFFCCMFFILFSLIY